MNSVIPSANKALYAVVPWGVSPRETFTIEEVMVYIAFLGSRFNSGYWPPAIVTIIVSPMARENPKIKDAMIPDKAAGNIIFNAVILLVEPSAREPILKDFGTAFSASSEIDAIVGMIIIPTAMPAEIALKTPDPGINRWTILGVIQFKAKYPKTTVGTPASISIIGFMTFLVLLEANSER